MWPFKKEIKALAQEPATVHTWEIHYSDGNIEAFKGTEYDINTLGVVIRNEDGEAVVFVPIDNIAKIELVGEAEDAASPV